MDPTHPADKSAGLLRKSSLADRQHEVFSPAPAAMQPHRIVDQQLALQLRRHRDVGDEVDQLGESRWSPEPQDTEQMPGRDLDMLGQRRKDALGSVGPWQLYFETDHRRGYSLACRMAGSGRLRT